MLMGDNYQASRDRPSRAFTTCESCKAHFGNGSETETECEECRDVVRLRTIALRLLAAESSPYFDDRMRTSHNKAERDSLGAVIDAFVLRIQAGEIVIPDVLPVPRGLDPRGREEREGAALTRVRGNGSRRTWNTNASRR